MVVLPTNHVSVFCMELCVSSRSYIKYIYMIGQEHSHVMLPNHASLSELLKACSNIAFNTYSS